MVSCTYAWEQLICTPTQTKRKQITNARNLDRQLVTAAPTNNQRIRGLSNFNYFSAFPTTLRASLPYCEVIGLTTAATANTLGAVWDFVPNSLYAPLGSGHQPYTFDQLCSANGPYTKYKVLGYKCKITLVNQSNVNPIHVVVRARNITDNYTLSGALVESALERQGSKLVTVPAGPGVAITTINVPDLSSMFNWSKEQYSADATVSVGAYGTAPDRLCTLQIASSNPAGTTQYIVNAVVEFMFDVVFLERQSVPSS